MALALGTNSGFVTSAPSADPAGSAYAQMGDIWVTKDESPVGASTITEVGWYCSVNSSGDTNFQMGLYDDSGGNPNDLLFSEDTNATGAATGWKTVTGLNWSISGETDYWIGMIVGLGHSGDRATSGGSGYKIDYYEFVFTDPWDNTSESDADGMFAIYALIGEAPPPPSTSINIGDAWKAIAGIQINIGDTWKAVASMQINIGDTWKAITI